MPTPKTVTRRPDRVAPPTRPPAAAVPADQRPVKPADAIKEAQQAQMLKVLADAFDDAAVSCGTKTHAALAIVKRLQGAGFAIVRAGSTEHARYRKTNLHINRAAAAAHGRRA